VPALASRGRQRQFMARLTNVRAKSNIAKQAARFKSIRDFRECNQDTPSGKIFAGPVFSTIALPSTSIPLTLSQFAWKSNQPTGELLCGLLPM
jgi:hypothetical protein